MAFLISNEEINLLRGLPSLHWQLYVILRKEMDVKTGYAGQSFPIFLRGLANSCYIAPGQGKQYTGSPSIGKIRITLNALAKAGLIEPHSITLPNKKQLIYHLKVAFHHLSASKKHDGLQACKESTQYDTAQIAQHCTHQDNKNNNMRTHSASERFLNTPNPNVTGVSMSPIAASSLSDLLSAVMGRLELPPLRVGVWEKRKLRGLLRIVPSTEFSKQLSN